MKKDAFILFLKYPERSTVKTRLARTLGDDLTYELYRCFLADISAMTHQVNAQTIIVCSGSEDASFSDFPDIPCIRQRGDNIGERMYNAFVDVFAQGFLRSVLIGSDSPDLPAVLINDAFDKLDLADVVLGPSTDGGYYLVGCKPDSLRQSIFSDIPWSTDAVFAKTLRHIALAGLKSAELQQWSDIDKIDDIRMFYKRNNNPTSTSQVIHFLKKKDILSKI